MIMRAYDFSMCVRRWVENIQSFDPCFKTYGRAWPEWEGSLSDVLFNAVYTNFGQTPNPRWMNPEDDGTSLRSRFLMALSHKSTRLNGQEIVWRLEDILDEAIEKHGEENIVSLLSDRRSVEIELYGHDFVPSLKRAGLEIRDEESLDRLVRKAQQICKAYSAKMSDQSQPLH